MCFSVLVDSKQRDRTVHSVGVRRRSVYVFLSAWGGLELVFAGVVLCVGCGIRMGVANRVLPVFHRVTSGTARALDSCVRTHCIRVLLSTQYPVPSTQYPASSVLRWYTQCTKTTLAACVRAAAIYALGCGCLTRNPLAISPDFSPRTLCLLYTSPSPRD